MQLLVLQQLLVDQEDVKLVETRKYRPRHEVSTISISGWERLEHPGMGSGHRERLQRGGSEMFKALSGIRLWDQVLGLNPASSAYQLCDLEHIIRVRFTISSVRLG